MKEWECIGRECKYWEECGGWGSESDCRLLDDYLESEFYLRRKREQETA